MSWIWNFNPWIDSINIDTLNIYTVQVLICESSVTSYISKVKPLLL